MGKPREPRRSDFLKSFVYPVLWIFLIPAIGLFFFSHAESTHDADVLKATLSGIDADDALSAQEKEAAKKFFREHPASELLVSDNPVHRQMADGLDAGSQFNYAQFRWGLRLSALSMIGSLATIVVVLLFVLLSLRSQAVQYYSLSIGWQVLKFVGLLQVVVQGVLVFGLSFWVPALWGNVFYSKLLLIAGIAVTAAVGLILKAMFVTPARDFTIRAEKLDLSKSPEFKDRIESLCREFQIDPPDQVLVGIDDNFFVTEHPVKVGDKIYRGKTLYLSIPLLKKLERSEADAILAHEMAHFSGQDTVYSKKISPLLGKYGQYLQALSEGTVSLPVFYFMFFF